VWTSPPAAVQMDRSTCEYIQGHKVHTIREGGAQRILKGTVSRNIGFDFKVCKIKSILYVGPLMFLFFYFLVLLTLGFGKNVLKLHEKTSSL
jgi:hypothetical protein